MRATLDPSHSIRCESPALRAMIAAARRAEPPVIHTGALTLAWFDGSFEAAALALEIELAAQGPAVLHRRTLADLPLVGGVPLGSRALVFDLWSGATRPTAVSRGPRPSSHSIAVVERGADVLILMPSGYPLSAARLGRRQGRGRGYTSGLRRVIENAVRNGAARVAQ
jgi:hypothetical protein